MKTKQGGGEPNTPKLPEWGKRFDEFAERSMVIEYPGLLNPDVPNWLKKDVRKSFNKKLKPFMRQFLTQELATLKAQVRKEIEEQITKMENSDWLHGMGLSGSQAEYIEANIKASYLSIKSLEE